MKRIALLMAGVAGAGVLGLTGGLAAASESAIGSTTTDAWAQTTQTVDVSTTGAVETPILSITLPAGKWVIHADETLVNFGPSDYAGCSLADTNNPDLNNHGVMVGDPGQSGAQGPAGYMGTVPETAAVVLATKTTVTVTCSHQSSNGATPYVNANADIWAHKASKLSLQQLP
jgi:hypothetical protein